MVEDKGVQLIFHHFLCSFKRIWNSDAFIDLFTGKTGDGKTIAINVFFNTIRCIKLKDDLRYILIEEAEKNQKDSQTDDYHLYYLKDKDNNPLIIIYSKGYGDTRGFEYDGKKAKHLNMYSVI